MFKKKLYCLTIAYLFLSGFLTACGETAPDTSSPDSSLAQDVQASDTETTIPEDGPESIPGDASVKEETPTITRDNTPVCLVPTADGTAETHNDVAIIDYSNASSGYVMADYTGASAKVKIRVTGPDQVIYTYDLHGNGYETFPLSSGDGNYEVTIFENISGTTYSTCLHAQMQVTLEDELIPYLYPNQYVNFTEDSKTVAKGAELVTYAANDLEVVTCIYDYITSSITYDYDKASDPPTGYTTDIDVILESGTGICLDYAAVMASMLRSQGIPTRLEVGYAQDAYHAWISVYTEETGWLNGIIEFDGSTWTLVDPTFGANTGDKALKKFIGDGSNYILQKMY